MTIVSLPEDDAYLKDQPVQWWYWTGHIKTESGRHFGFELCFFAVKAGDSKLFDLLENVAESKNNELFKHLVHKTDKKSINAFKSLLKDVDNKAKYFLNNMANEAIGQLPEITGGISNIELHLQMVNAAITDLDHKKFYSRIGYRLGVPHSPKDSEHAFDLHIKNHKGEWSAIGGGGEDQLKSQVEQFSLDIHVNKERPVVRHYNGKKHDYSFGGYTYYYSRELMSASGTINIDGEAHKIVESTIWFDRQYGDLFRASFVIGWQWFSFQLNDNTQIMIFAYNCQTEHTGSVTNSEDETISLGSGDFNVTVLDYWTSPVTKIKYPSKWQVTIDKGETKYDLHVVPQVIDQELNEKDLFPKYWEGSCNVDGSHQGLAYVEITKGLT